MNKWTHSNVICVIIGLAVAVLTGCGSAGGESAPPIPLVVPPPLQPTLQPIPPTTPLSQSEDNEVVVTLPLWARTYDFESLVTEADLIIEGAIVGVRETRSVSSAIFTDYVVDVSNVLKSYPGFTDRSVVIVHSGGTQDGLTQVIEGDEPYQPGDKVILFLKDISNDAVHSSQGATKYMVLMPGGRFHIDEAGKLSTPTRNVPVADTYRGQDKAVLEQDIVARVPTPSEYLWQAVQIADLIVEGRVIQIQETRLISDEVTPEEAALAEARGEVPGEAYTVYAFVVDQVLMDKIALYADHPRKPSKYIGKPVAEGQTLSIVEMGGTYKGITQRRTLVPFLQPGDRMILFLTGIGCGEGFPICSESERAAGQVLYMLSDMGDRFQIGSADLLTVFTRLGIEGLYAGQHKNQLEKAILAEKDRFLTSLSEQQPPPPTEQYPFPPPPTSTPTP